MLMTGVWEAGASSDSLLRGVRPAGSASLGQQMRTAAGDSGGALWCHAGRASRYTTPLLNTPTSCCCTAL